MKIPLMQRREFVLRRLPAAALGLALTPLALAPAAGAQPAQDLSESDPAAMALGFVRDTALADRTRFPKHTELDFCSGCLHYASPGEDPSACDVFGGKLVPARGWCSGYETM
jgi:hypothetical protein